MIIRILVCMICLGTVACGSQEPPRVNVSPPAATTSETSLSDYYAGEELYMTHCFFCHGKDADGKGALAASMDGPMPRNFTDPEIAATPPDSLKQSILKGGEAVGLSPNMPAWEGTISSVEAEHIVAFIQAVSKNGGRLPEPSDALKLTDIPQESQPTY